MSLAPGEQRMLAEIESQLGGSDPGLAAMFARFTAEGARMQPLLWRAPLLWRLPRCHRAPGHGERGYGESGHGEPGSLARMAILIAAAVLVIATCVAVAVVGVSHNTPSRGGHGSGQSPVSFYMPVRLSSGRVTSSSPFRDWARLYSSAR
ncbi:MAG: DUF3040 domain-containing protein [Acidimicrobiaceae bacterium]|nr:DUF3040 domain-containing protein [Acidimicrobiaceae bacterium]